MLNTFDPTTVRRYIADLNSEKAFCSDESTFCSDLDEVLGCHLEHCTKLQAAVSTWANEVFAGRADFDIAVETMFKAALRRAVQQAHIHVEHGYEVQNECFDLDRLQSLDYCLAVIEYLLSNWVSPAKSVAPSPRVEPTDATVMEVRGRLKSLPPPPSDWRPRDARQARILDGHP